MDLSTNKGLRKMIDRLTDQFVAGAQSEREPGSRDSFVGLQKGNRIGIDRIAVNGIDTLSRFQGKPSIL